MLDNPILSFDLVEVLHASLIRSSPQGDPQRSDDEMKTLEPDCAVLC
jgi:hypothetical protein